MTAKITTGVPGAVAWLESMVGSLANHSDRLDAINIFPVADGDTGSNLYLTARTAHDAVSVLQTDDLGEYLATAGRAGMESARGNSGTLLAVFLLGFSEPLRGHPRLTGPLVAAGLESGRVRAWSALSDPVPGTMLSVVAAAAQAAAAAVAESTADASSRAQLREVLDAMQTATRASVVSTENQLGALANARVVDAGAVGMMLVLDALVAAVTGEAIDESRYTPLHGYGIQDPHIHADSPAEDGVEVMCTIALDALNAATLRAKLDSIGTSVVMSAVNDGAEGYRWRVHVHVPEAEDALQAIREAGNPVNVSITDLCTRDA
ncbi:DAK2 domain-containing protein [Arthrobacter sp. JSM 101049]|uniref:DAK2 domain-containing protein n=1 Tax=Arthrobacter sp. JSM 101049 TaxID=929097 RepID=UPI00356211D0